MNSITRKLTLVIILTALFLAACGGAATPTAEAPLIVIDEFAVIAEGRLVPRQFVQVSFKTGGQVAELLVAEGDEVQVDQVIARLADQEQIAAQVAQAQLELVNARQAVDTLNRDADMARAQAELDVANAIQAVFDAERRANGVQYPDVEDYQDAVAKAQDNLAILESDATVTEIGSAGAAIQGAQDAVEAAAEQLGAVQSAEQGCGNCDPDRMADAQDAYNGALNALTTAQLQQQNAQITNQQAQADALEALDEAQRHLNAALAGPNGRQVRIAQAELVVARTRQADAEEHLQEIADGPDPDALEAAQARVTSAESGLSAAEAALENLELRAPFAGTIAMLSLKAGEQVAAGQAVGTLADFSSWVVETDNLTEIDVVKIVPGQGASIVLDALPDKTLRGEVTSIGTLFEEKRGDITYTVDVTLLDGDPLARWGMTAEVTFDQ